MWGGRPGAELCSNFDILVRGLIVPWIGFFWMESPPAVIDPMLAGPPDFLVILARASIDPVVVPSLLFFAVIVISGLGEGSRDLLIFVLLAAAANTSAIELLKVNGMAPVDSEPLNS